MSGPAPSGAPQHPSPPGLDPRLRARRIAVARAEARRRLHRVLAVAATLALGLGAWALVRSPLLDVDRVVISGTADTSADAVRSVTLDLIGRPLVDVDAGRTAADLEALPWVDEAHVERSWPSTVTVHVTERHPVAVASGAHGSGRVLVDLDGRVLAPAPAATADLATVVLDGAAPAPGAELAPEARAALALAARAPAAVGLAGGVVTDVDGDLSWDVPGVGRLHFGSLSRLDDKLLAAAVVVDAVPERPLGELDLREPSAVVRRRVDAVARDVALKGISQHEVEVA